MASNSLPAPTPVRFPLGSSLRHKKGGRYRVISTPDVCRIEKTLEPAYAYISEEGSIWIRPQAEMEDGRFEMLAGPGSEYEDLLEMVSTGEGLAGRQAAYGLSFIRIAPARAWDLLVASFANSAESPAALARLLNQIQFEVNQIRDFFLKRRRE